MLQIKTSFSKLPFITALLLILLPTNSESLSHQSPNTRRAFVIQVAAITTATTTAGGCSKTANAAIDVSGLKQAAAPTPGRAAPNGGPKSGLLAGTKLGYQVGGGPRSEEEVRAIDEPRYAAVRKAQGLGPKFLEGVPIEGQQQQQQEQISGDNGVDR